jgi:hypothetical protein
LCVDVHRDSVNFVNLARIDFVVAAQQRNHAKAGAGDAARRRPPGKG